MEINVENTNHNIDENENLSETPKESMEEPFDFLTEWNKIWEE